MMQFNGIWGILVHFRTEVAHQGVSGIRDAELGLQEQVAQFQALATHWLTTSWIIMTKGKST